jgi:hypothetical protein
MCACAALLFSRGRFHHCSVITLGRRWTAGTVPPLPCVAIGWRFQPPARGNHGVLAVGSSCLSRSSSLRSRGAKPTTFFLRTPAYMRRAHPKSTHPEPLPPHTQKSSSGKHVFFFIRQALIPRGHFEGNPKNKAGRGSELKFPGAAI